MYMIYTYIISSIYTYIRVYIYIYSCDILQHNQREAIGWFWVPAESVKQWLVNLLLGPQHWWALCFLLTGTSHEMVQSYPEGFSKRFRPPDPSEKCGMDSWLIFFFINKIISQVCPGSRIMRLKPYESIIFPHSRTTWPSWTLLLQPGGRRRPGESQFLHLGPEKGQFWDPEKNHLCI